MNTIIFIRIWHFIRIPLAVILILFIGLVIYRIPAVLEKQKTEEAVRYIHSQKITIDDVMGVNLPPVPDQAFNDSTLEGIDANQNGIRDDVELAIFKEYPNSAKTRAALLQYAHVLQMETYPSIINNDIATAISEEESRAYDCIGKVVPPSSDDLEKIETYLNLVKDKQLNTPVRKNLKIEFDKKTRSFELQSGCDVNLNLLSD